MPTTLPWNEFVARNDSRPGISTEYVGVGSSDDQPPIWNSENEAGCWVVHSASVEAIFIGWLLVTTTPNSLPHTRLRNATGSATTIASRAAIPNSSVLRPRRRCQA